MLSMADRNDGIRAASRAGKQDKEEEEKMWMLTRRLWAWSERLEEGRSSRISAETVQDEEDDVFFSGQIASILRAETTLAARQSRWRAWLVEGELRKTSPWRGGSSDALGCSREEETNGKKRGRRE
jgi:hypothetical protein